ncbi:hypothetical protein F8388_020995 [Cannabis sativa]|uniref:Uncharacterized protein n=1 Tax=Cannabis sativa TaxID=3483 RepID=A0A7J6DTI7_CANSA|nr:hypothetical protein F8388_020995 [Cannabis sativa]
MMRYQRVISPDCVPLSNGNGTKKPINREQDTITRFRSPSSSSSTQQDLTFQQSIEQPHHHHHHHHHHDSSSSPSPSRGSGDMLLQWGQKKRSRVSRTEIHKNLNMEDSSSSLSAVSLVQVVRQRRLPNHSGSTPKKLLNSNIMPPPPTPPPLPSSSSSSNGTRARKEVLLSHRNLEDRSGTNGSPSRICGGGSGRSTVGKSEKKVSSSCLARLGNDKVCDRLNSNHVHSTTTVTEHHHHHLHDHNNSVVVEKVNVEALEWPRIFLALSRKEKEDDFLAMKGTKLPQRPKKRPKNVDRALQYCFPGMWLSDLTRNRYEVREKKCVKKQKQRRGLKGMESLDSDSE